MIVYRYDQLSPAELMSSSLTFAQTKFPKETKYVQDDNTPKPVCIYYNKKIYNILNHPHTKIKITTYLLAFKPVFYFQSSLNILSQLNICISSTRGQETNNDFNII